MTLHDLSRNEVDRFQRLCDRLFKKEFAETLPPESAWRLAFSLGLKLGITIATRKYTREFRSIANKLSKLSLFVKNKS